MRRKKTNDMHAASSSDQKSVDQKFLRTLSPLAALGADALAELARKSTMETFPAGRLLFRTGDSDRRLLYLRSGEVELVSDSTTRLIKAGAAAAAQPLSSHQPHRCAARAKTKVTLVVVDRDLLDLLQSDSGGLSGSYEVTEIDSGDDTAAWMIRFLQSPAFSRLPTEKLQAVLARMESRELTAGSAVVTQGASDPYYYIVKSGKCLVTRHPAPDAPEIRLAELGVGDGFGEEALLTGSRRNATVTMAEDGIVMRLAKQDFEELLATPLVRTITADDARALLDQGAGLIDVRTQSEFTKDALPNATNLPLPTLRLKLGQLLSTREYIVYCGDGRQSVAAAFLMGQQGLKVRVLQDGRAALSTPEPERSAVAPPAAPTASTPAAGAEPVTPLQQRAAAGAERARRAEAMARQLWAEAEAARHKAEENAQRLKTTRTRLEAQIAELKSEVNARQQAEIDKARAQAEREAEAARAALQARQQAEQAAAAAQQEAQAIRRQLEQDVARLRAEAENERARAEQEARRMLEAAEQTRRKAAAEVAQLAAQAHSAAQRHAAELREQAEAEAQRMRQAGEELLRQAEAEAARLKAEAETARQAATAAPPAGSMAALAAELAAAERQAAAESQDRSRADTRRDAGSAHQPERNASGATLQPAAPGSLHAGLEIDVGEMRHDTVRVRSLETKTVIEGEEDLFIFQPPSNEIEITPPAPTATHPPRVSAPARAPQPTTSARPLQGHPRGLARQAPRSTPARRPRRAPFKTLAAALVLGVGVAALASQHWTLPDASGPDSARVAELTSVASERGWLAQVKERFQKQFSQWLGSADAD